MVLLHSRIGSQARSSDPYKSQQLQDYLRELAPRRQQTIQLTGAESSEVPDSPTFNTTRPIDIAAQRDQLKLTVCGLKFRTQFFEQTH